VLHGLVTAQPDSVIRAHGWKYDSLRPFLLEACNLISAAEAERRVLVLENLALRGESKVTRSLFAGLQIILPGEIAAAHRHTPNALRFVVEGEGAYTAVNGERVMISPGDFIVTPNWAWHDHGNIGTGPVVWMDGLDSAFTKFFGATFREDYPGETQPLYRTEGDSAAAFGSALLPVDYVQGAASPLLKYPYARTLEALHHLHKSQALHASHRQRRIDDGHGIGSRSHLARAGAVIDRVGVAPDKRLQLGVALHRRPRQNLVSDQQLIGICFRKPPRQLCATHQRIDIRLLLQIVGVDNRRRQGIGRSQTNLAV
jgi:gentisate 1,2-dioxygenase